MHKQRPIAQVLSDDGIYIITLSDYKNAAIPKDIQNIEGRYPKFVFLDLPNNPAEISTLKFTQELIEGASIETRADLYLASGAVPQKDLESRLEAFPFNQEENCRWIPVYASKTTGQACVSAEHGIIELKLAQRR